MLILSLNAFLNAPFPPCSVTELNLSFALLTRSLSLFYKSYCFFSLIWIDIPICFSTISHLSLNPLFLWLALNSTKSLNLRLSISRCFIVYIFFRNLLSSIFLSMFSNFLCNALCFALNSNWLNFIVYLILFMCSSAFYFLIKFSIFWFLSCFSFLFILLKFFYNSFS